MGPHEKAALQRRANELRSNSFRLSPWEGRELDEIEDELRRQEYKERLIGQLGGTQKE